MKRERKKNVYIPPNFILKQSSLIFFFYNRFHSSVLWICICDCVTEMSTLYGTAEEKLQKKKKEENTSTQMHKTYPMQLRWLF